MKHGLGGSSAIHKFNHSGKVFSAQHLCIGYGLVKLQYFLVIHSMSDFVLGREAVEGKAMWMSGCAPSIASSVGPIIEKETGHVLPVNLDPFSDAVKKVGEVMQFNIDSIAVERVKLVTLDVTVSYYRFRVEEDVVYRLACFWFTLVNKKVWYPLIPMDPVDIYHVSDMLMEYESGKHEMWCKMNDSLVDLLQRLEKEKGKN